MKKILYILISSMVTLWSCGEEDDIRPEIKVNNLYEIKDDPSDSIRHKVFEIYQNYGVSVFFNDTVGKVFIKTDINGDSVFKYECLDPAWTFTGFENVNYSYEYMTDPYEQSKFLTMVDMFLKKCSKTLYPYSIFVVNSFTTTDARDRRTIYMGGAFRNYYKLLLLTGNKSTSLNDKPDEIIRKIIEQRITDYIDLLSAFNRVSKEYIGKSWVQLEIDELTYPFEFEYYESYWGYWDVAVVKKWSDYPLSKSASCLNDNWWGVTSFSAEAVEMCRKAVREEIGKFGFVGQSVKNNYLSMPPTDPEDDLRVFVQEVMRYPRSEFERIWGGYPLVMQKYMILTDIIENELGVKL